MASNEGSAFNDLSDEHGGVSELLNQLKLEPAAEQEDLIKIITQSLKGRGEVAPLPNIAPYVIMMAKETLARRLAEYNLKYKEALVALVGNTDPAIEFATAMNLCSILALGHQLTDEAAARLCKNQYSVTGVRPPSTPSHVSGSSCSGPSDTPVHMEAPRVAASSYRFSLSNGVAGAARRCSYKTDPDYLERFLKDHIPTFATSFPLVVEQYATLRSGLYAAHKEKMICSEVRVIQPILRAFVAELSRTISCLSHLEVHQGGADIHTLHARISTSAGFCVYHGNADGVVASKSLHLQWPYNGIALLEGKAFRMLVKNRVYNFHGQAYVYVEGHRQQCLPVAPAADSTTQDSETQGHTIPIILCDLLGLSVGLVAQLDDGKLIYCSSQRTFSARESALWLLFALCSKHNERVDYLNHVGIQEEEEDDTLSAQGGSSAASDPDAGSDNDADGGGRRGDERRGGRRGGRGGGGAGRRGGGGAGRRGGGGAGGRGGGGAGGRGGDGAGGRGGDGAGGERGRGNGRGSGRSSGRGGVPTGAGRGHTRSEFRHGISHRGPAGGCSSVRGGINLSNLPPDECRAGIGGLRVLRTKCCIDDIRAMALGVADENMEPNDAYYGPTLTKHNLMLHNRQIGRMSEV